MSVLGQWRVPKVQWEDGRPVQYFVYFDTKKQALEHLDNQGLLDEKGKAKWKLFTPQFITVFDAIRSPE